jgi:phenylpyruvate tautomerase PptA (4-oxalocrotonate tautomerase family)
MPLIQLETSHDLSDQDKRQSLVKTLSRLTAEGTGKSERYVMASIRDRVAMTFGGQVDPCALVTIKSIGGLNPTVNQTLARQITEALEAELAIPQDRIYLTFEELAPTHWGWNGKTFG